MMAERLYAIRDPDEGLLDLFIRRSRSDLLKDFALGMHWPNLRRSMTDDEIDQMAAQRWASELEPEGYSVVPVRLVEVEEKGWRDTESGLKGSYGNCMGWSQMLCALKVWVEYGMNLREGAYK